MSHLTLGPIQTGWIWEPVSSPHDEQKRWGTTDADDLGGGDAIAAMGDGGQCVAVVADLAWMVPSSMHVLGAGPGDLAGPRVGPGPGLLGAKLAGMLQDHRNRRSGQLGRNGRR
jgi:hypothetical protein